MCLGRKCPCIYPHKPHLPQEFQTLRARSPLDRQMICDRMNTVSKQVIQKLQYMVPCDAIRYSAFALCSLLGLECSWAQAQKLLKNYSTFVDKVSNIDISLLTQEQVRIATEWAERFEQLKITDNQMFYNIVKDILDKVEIVKPNSPMPSPTRSPPPPSPREESPQVLDIVQTAEDVPTISLKEQQSQQSTALRTLNRKSYRVSPDSRIQTSEFIQPSEQPQYINDKISLRARVKQLEQSLRQRQLTEKRSSTRTDTFERRAHTKLNNYLHSNELSERAYRHKQDIEFLEKQCKDQLKEHKKHIEYRRELRKSPINQNYMKYVEKYAGKYIEQLDKVEQEKVEIDQLQKQILMLEQQF